MTAFSTPQIDEQRGSLRRPVNWRVFVRAPGGSIETCRALNMSAGGLLIESEFPVALGADLLIKLDAYHGGQPIKFAAHAIVRHVVLKSGCYRVGLQFMGLQDAETHLLEQVALGQI